MIDSHDMDKLQEEYEREREKRIYEAYLRSEEDLGRRRINHSALPSHKRRF